MTPTEQLAAHPYRPIARGGVAVLVVAVAVAVTWFAWAAAARRRLDRQIGLIRQRGEPVTAADMPNPPVGDADNAAPLWRAAAAGVSTTVRCPAEAMYVKRYTPLYPPAWWKAAVASEAANAAVFPIADAAAARPAARWADGPSDVFAVMPLNGLNELGYVLGDSALLAHLGDHDDGRLIHRLHDGLRLAAAVEAQPHTVTTSYANRLRRQLVNAVMVVMPTTDVGQPGTQRRWQAEQLVADLLAAGTTRPDRDRGAMANRVVNLTQVPALRATNLLLSPLVDLSAELYMKQIVTDLEAERASDAVAAAGVYISHPQAYARFRRQPPILSGVFDDQLIQSTMYNTSENWVNRCVCRAGAIAVAMRLYRVDHGGTVPASLTALVPDYLPAVPADPYVAGSPPMMYFVRPHDRPDGTDRPLVMIGDSPTRPADPATAAVPCRPADVNSPTSYLDLDPWAVPFDP